LRCPLLPGVGVYAQTPTRSNAAVSTRNEAVRGGTGVAVYSRLAREKPGKNRRRTEREGLIIKKITAGQTLTTAATRLPPANNRVSPISQIPGFRP
jgi:hypothetical protein